LVFLIRDIVVFLYIFRNAFYLSAVFTLSPALKGNDVGDGLQLALASGTRVIDVLASRKLDELSYKYSMLVSDSPQPGFSKGELIEITNLVGI
jgi:hypothetical protein